jgi:hypothetical protein
MREYQQLRRRAQTNSKGASPVNPGWRKQNRRLQIAGPLGWRIRRHALLHRHFGGLAEENARLKLRPFQETFVSEHPEFH